MLLQLQLLLLLLLRVQRARCGMTRPQHGVSQPHRSLR
jgi:hypothetical protein